MAVANVRAAYLASYGSGLVPTAETDLFQVALPRNSALGMFTLLLNITKGSLTNYQVNLYATDDGSTWYPIPAISSLTQTPLSAATTTNAIPVFAPGAKLVRVSIQSTGTQTGSALTAKALLQVQ